MNVPNKLTVLRIILVPIFVFLLLTNFIPYNFLFAEIIFIIASLTDFFDGKIARKNNQITNFGKFLDPVADKILVMSAFICFVKLGFIGAVPVIIILCRDFMVTSVRLMAASNGEVVSANIFGKAKTISQMVTVIVIILLGFVGSVPVSIIISNVFIWISVIFTVISGIIYICDNIKFIKS